VTAPDIVWVNTEDGEDGCYPMEQSIHGHGKSFNRHLATSYTRTDAILALIGPEGGA